MKTHKLEFPLTVVSKSLRELVSFFSTNPEEIRKTSMMYWYGTLYLSYDITGNNSNNFLPVVPPNSGGGTLLYLEVDQAKIAFERIRYNLTVYSLANNCLNCHISFSVKGNRLLVFITPLDEKCRDMLNNLPPVKPNEPHSEEV